jgi:MFS family permease
MLLTKSYEATIVTAPEKVVSRDLIVLSSTFFCIFMGAASLQQYLIPYVAGRTGHSHAACSWILASVYLSSIVWRILYTYTLEWLGARWAIVGGFLTYTLFAVVALFSTSYTLLLISALIWGWGAAAIWITGPSQILQTTSSLRYGRASGLFYSAVYAGQGLGVYLLGWLLDREGARAMLVLAIGITLIGNLLSLATPSRTIHRDPPSIRDVLSVLTGRRSQILSFLLFSSSVGFGIVIGPFSSLVAESTEIAFWVAVGFYGGRLVTSWLGGWMTDRVGRYHTLVGGFLIAAVGLGLGATFPSPVVLLLTSMALGLQVGFVPVSVMALIGDETEEGRRHLAFGAIYVWSNLGVGLTIVLGQYLRLLFGFRTGFLTFALLFLLCAGLAMEFRKKKGISR